MSKLLSKNPKERLADIDGVRNHPWFAEVDWQKLREKKADSLVPWVPHLSERVPESSINSKNTRDETENVISIIRDSLKGPKTSLKWKIRERIEEMKSETSSCHSDVEDIIELDGTGNSLYHLSVSSPRTSSSYGVDHTSSNLSFRSHSPQFP